MKQISIEMRELRYFVAVAEELHFGRAAERLHISQPPLSQQIRRLEAELGTPLFHRTTRRVWMTDAGTALLGDARAILAQAEEAVRRVRAVAAGEEGRLRVGAVTPAIDSFLPRAVRAFRERHPRIAVELSEMPTAAQLEALRADRLELGFVRLFDHDLRGIGRQVVSKERLVAALPEGHHLAARRRLTLRALAAEPLITLPRHVQPALFDLVVAAFERQDVTPRIVQTAATVHGVRALVAAGMGAALVPASSAELRRPGVAFRPVRGRLPPVEISAVWRLTDTSAALGHFRKVVREAR